METNKLSVTRIKRIREQGYVSQTEQQINDLAFGNRFAFRACVSILIVGVAFANIPLLAIMMLIAIMGVVLPRHPFDYFYNGVLSNWLQKPKLPKRSVQLKFSCFLASLFIATTIYLFSNSLMLAGYLVGASLITVALLVASIDFCIPSILFNRIFQNKTEPSITKY